jgi:hypothetical protein
MTTPIGRRLDRLETEVEKRAGGSDDCWRPGGRTFQLIDDPRDPENVKRWKEAEQFRGDNPNGLLIHHILMSPPNGEPDWRRYIEAGTNIEIAEAQVSERSSLLSAMIQRIDAETATLRRGNYLPRGNPRMSAIGPKQTC